MTRYPHLYETLTGEGKASLDREFQHTRERYLRQLKAHGKSRQIGEALARLRAEQLRREVGRG